MSLNIHSFINRQKDSTDASVYLQLFTEIRNGFRDYIPVDTDSSQDENSVACTTVVPPDTVVSTTLPIQHPYLLLILVNKALEQLKILLHLNIFTLTFLFPDFTVMEHPLIEIVIRKCIFNLSNEVMLDTQP